MKFAKILPSSGLRGNTAGLSTRLRKTMGDHIILFPIVTSPIHNPINSAWASLIVQLVKNPPAMQETLVLFVDQEDPKEKG